MNRRADIQDALDRVDGDLATANAMGFALPREGQDRLIMAIEIRRLRRGLAAVLGKLIGGLMDDMEDGTPVLELVFAQDPGLRKRLREALEADQEVHCESCGNSYDRYETYPFCASCSARATAMIERERHEHG